MFEQALSTTAAEGPARLEVFDVLRWDPTLPLEAHAVSLLVADQDRWSRRYARTGRSSFAGSK